MKKTIIGLVVASCLFSNVSFGEFSDVSSTHWAYSNIEKMQQVGIINGYLDGTFKPNNNINLAEFATIFTKVFEIPKDTESNYFPEVPNTHWAKGSIEAVRKYINPYYDSIGEAIDVSAYSYMDGITGDLEMTREAFVYAVSTIYGYNENEYIEGEEKELFEDYNEILFPKETVLAYKNGVIKGEIVDGKTYIRPTRRITRAEASAIFSNLLDDDERVKNEKQDNELISAVDNVINKLKENDFESIKNGIYDTAKVLKNEYFTVSEENVKALKEATEKYFKKFKYEVVETGFNGFNNGYVKIKVKGYDIKQQLQDVFGEVYLKFDVETTKIAMTEFLTNFSEGIKKKTIKVEEIEEIFNFVKKDGEWKLCIQ